MGNCIVTLLLVWAGVNKFIQGKKGMGFLYLFTFGLFGIGWLVDIIIAATKLESSSAVHPPVPASYGIATSATKTSSKVSDVDMSKWKQYRNCFIAFDLETTGVNANKDRIIEISAVVFKNFTPCEIFSSLVNPEMPIPASASKVNHIYAKDVANAPVEKDCIKDFCKFIGERCLNGEIALVAHNASFDSKFLALALDRCGVSNKITYLDTLRLARKSELGLENNKLGTLANHFGIKQYSAHRAEDDARVCGEIFVKLLQQNK